MAGEMLSDFGLSGIDFDNREKSLTHIAVKEAVFPFARFPGVDIVLGPEMKSTGEVMGLDKDFPRAFAKSQIGAGTVLPLSGTALMSLKDGDKLGSLSVARKLINLGFGILATRGTQQFLTENGLDVTAINKVLEGRPHCVDAMISGQIQLVINTTEGAQSLKDSFDIRRTALTRKVCHYTTLSAAEAAVDAIAALRDGALDVAPLQSYF